MFFKKKDIKNNTDFPSELRMDVVNSDWVVIAKGRAKKPGDFKKEKKIRWQVLEKDCPFCDIKTQNPPVLIMAHGKEQELSKKIQENWTTVVFPNKYPAFIKSDTLNDKFVGPLYKVMNAVGFHEVVATKEHKKQIADFSVERVKELFDVYQKRYLFMAEQRFVNYVSIFHNFGAGAGASIEHTHSQIITTPLIDSDLRSALSTAENYFNTNKKCIYCALNEWEIASKERIIYENKEFLAVCPFASKSAFEVIVSPKKHLPYFEKITEQEKWELADAFLAAIRKIYKGLGDPDYNFYLHTAPCDSEKHDYYHWHWTIIPKTSTWAGFEIGTRMEISTIEPEKAAEFLKNVKV